MARRTRRTAEDRLARLLVMLPWLMEQGSVPINEVASRFDLTEAEVVADLELASMCGLPPYVDELIDVFIDEGMVYVGVPRLFTRPLRLNSLEAFELLLAARSAMSLPGADPLGPLGRGLTKLAAALGVEDSSQLGVDVEIVTGPHVLVEHVLSATERATVIQIHYWNPNREEVSLRRVYPLQVFNDRGNWYLVAFDPEADGLDPQQPGALRTFRADRILELEDTGASFERPSVELPAPGEWFTDHDTEQVTLRLRPGAMWITERYPMLTVSDPDAQGWTTVTTAVVSSAWLERLLLRLGPDVDVVSSLGVAARARAAATRMLEVYGVS
jgi:proteasome accessory factor C